MARPRARKKGLTVAITGAAGYVAGGLIQALDADERVERVLGFDVRPPSVAAGKLVFDNLDVRNPSLAPRLAGVDALVHLAFVMDPIKDEDEMRDINVNGSQNVFRCAGEAGVRKLIYTSSGVAYGAHPDNDLPLTEESPLRANLDFSYPAHKLEVEFIVREFREEYPNTLVTVFRPSIVFGPHVDNAWSHFLELPVLIGVKGAYPPFQFVHEDDVRRALTFAVFNDLDGAYNLGPKEWVTYERIRELVGKRSVQLPEPFAYVLMDRLWRAGLGEAPAGMVHYIVHPWVMSADKLEAAGFVCERTSEATLEETLEHLRGLVRIGRSRVRSSSLAAGAVAGAGAIGGTLALGLLRRRRRAAGTS